MLSDTIATVILILLLTMAGCDSLCTRNGPGLKVKIDGKEHTIRFN